MTSKFQNMSRRDRVLLLVCLVVLLVWFGLYPAWKATAESREEQRSQLMDARELLADYQVMIKSKDIVKEENDALHAALGDTERILFDSVGNEVMTEAMMVKVLNQCGPSLDLNVSATRSSLRDAQGQFNFSVKGTGRYPEILNFLYQIETHRPLIVIDDLSFSVQKERKRRGGPQRGATTKKKADDKATEPKMQLKLSIHITCSETEEGAQ